MWARGPQLTQSTLLTNVLLGHLIVIFGGGFLTFVTFTVVGYCFVTLSGSRLQILLHRAGEGQG